MFMFQTKNRDINMIRTSNLSNQCDISGDRELSDDTSICWYDCLECIPGGTSRVENLSDNSNDERNPGWMSLVDSTWLASERMQAD
jgi:hypothetical protein